MIAVYIRFECELVCTKATGHAELYFNAFTDIFAAFFCDTIEFDIVHFRKPNEAVSGIDIDFAANCHLAIDLYKEL